MDEKTLDRYWCRLHAKEASARVGKIDDWDKEALRACFNIFEEIEAAMAGAASACWLDGMLVLSGDIRTGHGRLTAMIYSPHHKDPERRFLVRRLEAGSRLDWIAGKTHYHSDLPWEPGVNLVAYGPNPGLDSLRKKLKNNPPASSALAGEVEEVGYHRPGRLFFRTPRGKFDQIVVHLRESSPNTGNIRPTAGLSAAYPLYLASEAVQPNEALEVRDKYSGEVATRVALADAATIERAIAAAAAAEPAMRAFPPYARQAVLEECVARFGERQDELALALCIEAGKPIKDAEGEVTRLIDTFRVAAEEAVRIDGEVLNLEISKRADGYRGFVQRVPIGACSFITPFNFPLNLVAHKVAPAIAAGCPFVLKPSEKTPVGALIIGEVLAATELPKGAFSVLPCRIEDAGPFVADERLKLLSFTGGQVGWELKAKAGRKKVVLELGGNAACIVDADQRDRLDHVVERLVFGSYYQSGQSCIKVQRIYAHRSIHAELRSRFVAATRALKAGDPRERDTFLGPLIDEASAERLATWIAEAEHAGAKRLCGGGRERNRLEATVLEDVPRDAKLNRLEAFGPITLLEPFDEFDDALARVNDSDYGLQAGVFTDSLAHATRAWDRLDVGGVVVNDVPSFRVDNMPYGGVKRSGLGREGIRYAIEDMTERRLMVLRG